MYLIAKILIIILVFVFLISLALERIVHITLPIIITVNTLQNIVNVVRHRLGHALFNLVGTGSWGIGERRRTNTISWFLGDILYFFLWCSR